MIRNIGKWKSTEQIILKRILKYVINKVAEWDVILVGRVIKGKNVLEYII